jgi:hypothetical protein
LDENLIDSLFFDENRVSQFSFMVGFVLPDGELKRIHIASPRDQEEWQNV